MANSIKIGGFSFDALKIGNSDVDAAYIGDTLVYSGGTPPTPTLQWVTFTNESPQTDPSGLYQIYGIKFNSFYLDNVVGDIAIFNENTGTEASFTGGGRGRVNFYSWDGCNTTSSSNEDIEMDFTNGYTDGCGNETEPPYYLDVIASGALDYLTYQLLIYQ